jgi:site-specific recombinase XerD
MIEDNFEPVKLKLSTLNDHLEKFIASYADKSKETRGTYQRALKEFVVFFATDRKFQFRVRDVERYKKYLKHTKKLQDISVATYLTAVRRFCQYLVEAGVIEKNPAKRVQGGRRPQAHNRTFLTLAEIEQLFESIEKETNAGLRDRAIIHTMIGCACSELEITRANIGDFKKDGRKHLLLVQGKGKAIKDETIPVPKQAAEAIGEYLKTRTGELSPEDALFVSYSNRSQNQRMSIRGVREAIGQRLKASGVKKGRDLKLTPFSLRHTAGILLAEAGTPVEELMRRMRIEWRPTAMLYYRQKGKLANDANENTLMEIEAEVE